MLDDVKVTLDQPMATARASVQIPGLEGPSLVGCAVTLMDSEGRGLREVYSDASGEVELMAAPGSYLLAPRDYPTAGGSGAVALELGEHGLFGEPPTLEFSADATAKVQLLDADGAPERGALVVLRVVEDGNRRVVRQGRTDDGGVVEFERLHQGEHEIAAEEKTWEHWLIHSGETIALGGAPSRAALSRWRRVRRASVSVSRSPRPR